MEGKRLGVVVSGSLDGLEVKLDPSVSVEELAIGKYVIIEGRKRRFFGLITDLNLKSIDDHLICPPPDDEFLAQVLSGSATYVMMKVRPELALDVLSPLSPPQRAKTIPEHFSLVREASQRDIELVFGKEDERRFYIGNPLDMETVVCLDLEELVKRSNGVFGKSGTGKTFLTRLLLIGIIQKNVAVNLVFDMHNEYGWEGRSEAGIKVKGLKQLFPSKVAIFSLDKESAVRRRVAVDFVVRIGYNEIEPEDIWLLRETLNLTELAQNACYKLPKYFGREWLSLFLSLQTHEEVAEVAKKIDEHEATIAHLHRRLQHLKRLPFLVPQTEENVVERILSYLERGISVVLEFGRYGDVLPYILVANLLTRRIYDRYRQGVEAALGGDATMPHPLFITVEEAHRFLSPPLSSQTIFGTIAREMRKYNVTLLIVDQRPGVIDTEVMSQLGTKICCLLDDGRDVEAVLSGVSDRGALRSVLSRLESRQQALIFGHALPMPIVVRVREYGSARSYQGLGIKEPAELKKQIEKDIVDLWG